MFITGLSGNGKTLNVSQACAQLKRELIRVNIIIETDEDDLLAVTDYKMATVWQNGLCYRSDGKRCLFFS